MAQMHLEMPLLALFLALMTILLIRAMSHVLAPVNNWDVPVGMIFLVAAVPTTMFL